MKFPGDNSDKNLPDFLDPKTPDFIDGVLADIVRNFIGLGFNSAVDPSIIGDAPTFNPSQLSSSSPRDSIAAHSKQMRTLQPEKIVEIEKLIFPSSPGLFFPEQLITEFNKVFQSGMENIERSNFNLYENPPTSNFNPHEFFFEEKDSSDRANPRNELSPRANIDVRSPTDSPLSNVNSEPQSLFDIFLDRNSPFSVLGGLSSELNSKLHSDFGFGHERNGEQRNSVTWSSVSVVTSADGITRTRKTVKHADGTEETTETISSPKDKWLSDSTISQDTTLDSSRLQSVVIPMHTSSFFNTLSSWWHHVST